MKTATKETTVKKVVKKVTKVSKHQKGTKGGKGGTKKGGKKAANSNGQVSNPNNPLHVGSTRLRLFRILSKFPQGLSASQIKQKTGMLANSGHLAVLLGEEYDNGRINCQQHDIGGKDVFIYLLTKKGLKDFKVGNIDKSKLAGNRIGKVWTKARIDKETKSVKK